MLTLVRTLVYLGLAVIAIVVLVMTMRTKRHSKLDSSMVLVCVMLFCWQFFEIIFLFAFDDYSAKLLFDLKLPFVAMVTVAYFLYIVRFYGLESYFPPLVIACLLIIPAFTLGFAATTTLHPYLREVFHIFQFWPTLEYEMARGPWFWIHSVFCYLLAVLAIALAVRQHLRLPKSQRLPSVILLVGLVVIFTGNIAVLFAAIEIDLSLVAATMLVLFLYQATRNHRGLDFMQQTRAESFHQIERALFILDDKEEIVSMNRTAQSWLESEGIKPIDERFHSIKEQIQEKAVSQTVLEEDEGGADYYFSDGEVYNIRQKPIIDNEGAVIGHYASISNETSNRSLIKELDERSGIDALTGLSNRRQMELDIERYESEGTLPLSVLMGDLNDLKLTNDTLGHQQGDILLRVVAETFRRVSPPVARISRIGGDEFVILLPQFDDRQVSTLAFELRKALKKENVKHPFPVSVAIGYATKDSQNQTIHDVLALADARMYEDKNAYKAGRV